MTYLILIMVAIIIIAQDVQIYYKSKLLKLSRIEKWVYCFKGPKGISLVHGKIYPIYEDRVITKYRVDIATITLGYFSSAKDARRAVAKVQKYDRYINKTIRNSFERSIWNNIIVQREIMLLKAKV